MANYFRTPRVLFQVFVHLGLGLLILSIFAPGYTPFNISGRVANVFGFQEKIFCGGLLVMAILLHVIEGLYAYKLARNYGFDDSTCKKWLLQTLLYGYLSLGLLKRYRVR